MCGCHNVMWAQAVDLGHPEKAVVEVALRGPGAEEDELGALSVAHAEDASHVRRRHGLKF